MREIVVVAWRSRQPYAGKHLTAKVSVATAAGTITKTLHITVRSR